jgi:hypothetical protein
MTKKVTTKTVTKKTEAKTKTAPRKRATPKTAAKSVAPVSEAQVRARAYEIFRSGRNASNPDADWIQAEQELTAELS